MSDLVVRARHVLLDGELGAADIGVTGGLIDEIAGHGTVSGADILDWHDGIVSPGLIDLQCNGAAGRDLTADPSCLLDVAAALLPHGVTSWLPTVVTAPRSTRERAVTEFRSARGASGVPRPLGLHFEGPALSPAHPGAHPPQLLAVPDEDELDEWCRGDAVRMVTVAPEVDGVVPMIERLVAAGVLVSCGHTAMTPEDLHRAVDAGARYVTHLFNAMSPFHHRRPGAIGATLDSRNVVAGLICDGHHAAPAAIRLARSALGPAHISLVSDASAALDAALGTMRLGTFEVENTPTGPRLPDGTLAGSAIGIDDAVRNYRHMTGASVEEALAAASSTPADLLGRGDIGRIVVGARADLTLLDPDLRVARTIIGGDLAWKS